MNFIETKLYNVLEVGFAKNKRQMAKKRSSWTCLLCKLNGGRVFIIVLRFKMIPHLKLAVPAHIVSGCDNQVNKDSNDAEVSKTYIFSLAF